MQRIYKGFFLIATFLFGGHSLQAQNTDTIPVSVNPELQNIFNSRTPKEYNIAGINVTGTKAFDPNLIISISGLAVGDKVQIPGTDVFGKAISKLWRQNLISNVQIFFTRLEGRDLYIEMVITERPRLLRGPQGRVQAAQPPEDPRAGHPQGRHAGGAAGREGQGGAGEGTGSYRGDETQRRGSHP
ncbi:MAG TPA: hypothetical protein PLA61_05420 [Ferruginibacter sp.]|nr:hypothetical protein [Ferruginibacter sp.]